MTTDTASERVLSFENVRIGFGEGDVLSGLTFAAASPYVTHFSHLLVPGVHYVLVQVIPRSEFVLRRVSLIFQI